jgi:L-aspartate oxidase
VNPAPLISEAVRGAGATLVDRDGRRFVFDVDPRGELASRDIVAQAVAAVDRSGGAWLDARHVADFAAQFPGVTAMLARHGLDPTRDRIPVTPAMHYAMGGIRTDLDGRTTLPGLWAVGEVASTGVHGANRLASNSLLEALVFADRAARALAAARDTLPSHAPALVASPPDSHDDAAYEAVRSTMRRVMSDDVGVRRSEASLLRAERTLAGLAASTPQSAWRTRNQLLVSLIITRAALRRRESRGGHARVDFPEHALA